MATHPRAGILDLPTETLVSILENPTVPTSTLYSLAVSCRRLHFVALPIYFSRHGLTPSSKSIVIDMRTDRRDVLAALQTALLIPNTEEITCTFPHPSCTSIFPLLTHLTRLENYLSRLPSVRHVTLCLDTRGSVCLAVGDDKALRAWTTRMKSLLNCILEKQCECLTMMYGGQLTKSYKLTPPATRRGPIMRLLSAISCVLRGRTSEIPPPTFSRVSRQGHAHIEMSLRPPLHHSYKLASLEIHSAILILPPGLSWTLAVLRTCPTISLTLGCHAEAAIPWSAVLPLIASAATHVTSLTLSDGDSDSWRYSDAVAEAEILDFISRLPRLRHLSISHHSQTDFVEGPLLNLPDLETLRAPAKLILHSLRRSVPPKIQSICVLWSDRDLVSIGLLAAALSALPSPPRVSVSVTSSMYRPAFPIAPSFLERVGALEITPAPYVPLTDITELAAWVGVFPRVRHVDVAFDPKSQGFHADLAIFLGAVKVTAVLDKIKVNGRVYNLPHAGMAPTLT
ncbi:hypothetical protein DFH08DRAFT_385174 [Mycena albidolilacea]|uniref:F-box domain-containing protein n=1 Tax=Mycena albidolilacea TaxID=1033008 RepID=A0AAD6ZFX6_9AGAR|nr:hypothetical protein DFH08DRAFT_385174 [Mycena albidolilacea]